MAREADCLDESHYGSLWADKLVTFANLIAAAEREILANWMRQHGFSTGQAYTTDSLLDRLGTAMVENVDAAVLAEREACAKLVFQAPESDDEYVSLRETIALAINARG